MKKPGTAARADTGPASLFSGISRAPAIRNKSALPREYNEVTRGSPPTCRHRFHPMQTPTRFAASPARFALLCWLLCLLLGLPVALAQTNDADAALDQIRHRIDTLQQALKNSDAPSDAELQALRGDALAAQSQAAGIADQLAPQLAGLDARGAQLGTPAPAAN